ncbi:LPS-assembly protein LptD [Allopusillimonas soli]|uniref:LPS-assembly protein LptD n=2 Tax=Allopusillimonas soli TaxID=659016 RepID=A0A853FGL3_9BURK|nr:LPS-assembly protein LptD [Allopusillimonas soli]TEA70287.1 LPS-assembly protein LptD [Allopusillimonas soli]
MPDQAAPTQGAPGLSRTGAAPGASIGGLTVAPKLELHKNVDDNDMSSFIVADKVETAEDGRIILRGNAEVRRIDSVVKGDYIDYDRSTGDARVRGNGLIMREGSIVRGSALNYNVNAETGDVNDANFWMGGSGGAGQASHADILSRSRMHLDDVQYTGCPCPDPAWYISSPSVDLDFDKNEGVARHGVLYFKDVPILYSPYLTFPVKKERKSGFLIPTYGTSTNSGFEFSLPYYFNIAPNYDATLTPRYLSKRGLQLGGQFRYLGNSYAGQLEGTYLSTDNVSGDDRWLFMAQHRQNLGGGFKADVDLRRVSDDDYFRDFSSFGLTDSTVNYLPSRARVTWSGLKYFSGYLGAFTYQTLQDDTLGYYARPQYNKLPELYLRGARYNWGGFDVVSDNYATKFRMPFYSGRYSGPIFDPWRDRHAAPDGERYTSYTSISYPIVHAGWYITPKVGLHLSQYSTDWYHDDLGATLSRLYSSTPDTVSRAVPIMSLDSGMTFERDTTLFGNDMTQTLEPRVYYLRVPYVDQSDIPVYDTSLASFNFAQAFDENIFSGGWDRISNANQVTIGLTSRWLDAESGFERLSLSAAQRIYFEDQKVGLYTSDKLRTNEKSDYLFGARAALTDTFDVRFDAQYNPHSHERNRMSAGIRWNPKRLTTVSASYRYERDPRLILDPEYVIDPDTDRTREQVSLAGQWPLTRQLYVMGRYDYSLQEKRSTQSIFGLEYQGDCCWTARMVLQRYAVSREDVNTAVFFQLELAGLGSLGTDPMSTLKERVIGYESTTPPTPQKTTFERYE